MPSNDLISIVTPCYNESVNIRPLYDRLKTVMEKGGYPNFELIVAENGSTDGSAAVITELHRQDSRVKMVQLSRNYGYQGAITAGMHFTAGRAVVSMDCDLQDPPELVPELLKKIEEGYDVAYGVRTKRQEGFCIRLCYKLFYLLWQKTARIPVPRDAGDFCAMSRRAADHVIAFPERNRFIRGLRAWIGFKQTGVPYERHARNEGDSKFSLLEYFSFASDALIAFSTIPLRALTFMGLFGTAFFLVLSLYVLTLKILVTAGTLPAAYSPRGFALQALLITAFGAINCLGLGIIGEYVGRIYEETKQRPHFIVAGTLGLPDRRYQHEPNQ